jgi:hypothetical protein
VHQTQQSGRGADPPLLMEPFGAAPLKCLFISDILKRLGLFQLRPSLLNADEYKGEAQVPLSCFSSFVDIVSGAPITVSEANCESLQLLSEEFRFNSLSIAE